MARKLEEILEMITYDHSKPIENITHYQIMNRRTGQKVGTVKTKQGARRAVDNHDNKYGGYAHHAVAIYKDR